MDTQGTRRTYEAPRLEVQHLRDLPSALAHSSNASSNSHGQSDNAAAKHS